MFNLIIVFQYFFFYCLAFDSCVCAEDVNLETTRVRARFSARKRSFSFFSFCRSYNDIKEKKNEKNEKVERETMMDIILIRKKKRIVTKTHNKMSNVAKYVWITKYQKMNTSYWVSWLGFFFEQWWQNERHEKPKRKTWIFGRGKIKQHYKNQNFKG